MTLMAASLLAILLSFPAPALAGRLATASRPVIQPPPVSSPEQFGPRLNSRLQEIARELNVTEQQKAELKPVLEAAFQAVREVRDNDSLTRPEKWAALQEIQQETVAQVKEILTPEQFDQWQKRHQGALAGKIMRERFQRMAHQLNLTDQQKAELKPILQAAFEAIKAVHQDDTLTRRQKLAKIEAIRSAILAQAKQVLTPQQLEKWRQLHNQKRPKFRRP